MAESRRITKRSRDKRPSPKSPWTEAGSPFSRLFSAPGLRDGLSSIHPYLLSHIASSLQRFSSATLCMASAFIQCHHQDITRLTEGARRARRREGESDSIRLEYTTTSSALDSRILTACWLVGRAGRAS